MVETHSLDSRFKHRIHRIKAKSEKLFMAWRKFFKVGFRRSRKSQFQCSCDADHEICNCNPASNQLDKCEKGEADESRFRFAGESTPPNTSSASRNDNKTHNVSDSNQPSAQSSSGSSVAESKLLPVSELMTRESRCDDGYREATAEQVNTGEPNADTATKAHDDYCAIPPPSPEQESLQQVESRLLCFSAPLDQNTSLSERGTVETVVESDRSRNLFKLAGAVALAEFSASRQFSDSRHALVDDPFINRERPISDQPETPTFQHTGSSCYFFAKSNKHVERNLLSSSQGATLDDNVNDQQHKDIHLDPLLNQNDTSVKENTPTSDYSKRDSNESSKPKVIKNQPGYGHTALSLDYFEESENKSVALRADSCPAPSDDHNRFLESIVSLKAFEAQSLSLDLNLNLKEQTDASKNGHSSRQSQDILSTKSRGSGKIMSSIRKAFNSSHHTEGQDIDEEPKEIQHELPPLEIESSFSLGASFTQI